MKIFLVRTQIDKLFTPDQLGELRAAGDLVTVETVQPFGEIPGLFDGDEERVLAIDPDSCDWTVPNVDLDRIPNLRAVVLSTTSFSWVDVAHLKERGIPVATCPGFSSVAVAEWATMATLMLARKMPLVIKGGWKLDFEAHRGFELRGKTAGVVGLGRIGKAVAENCAGLGMRVRYWSRQTRDERFAFTELVPLMAESDVIVLCLERNAETAQLLTDDLLHSMKPTAIFIRTGFPPNHDLLLKMVAEGALYGYGFDDDRPNFDARTGNVFASPPLGWLTNESVAKSAEMWTEAILRSAAAVWPT